MDEHGQEVSGLTLNSLSGGGEMRRRLVGLPYPQLSPEVWQRVGPLLEDVEQRGGSAVLENQLFCIHRNGYAEETYLSFRCSAVPDHAANVQGVMVRVDETTDQVISARRDAMLRDLSTAGTRAHSVEDACSDALEFVSQHSTDIPFALLYVRNPKQREACLVTTAALAAGTPASPHVLAFDFARGGAGWPVAAAIETNRTVIVDDLLTRFEPLPAGDWPMAPRCAAIVPLATRERDKPDCALILGVSARRELDTAYLDFIELVAKHLVGVITAGRQREEAERAAVNRAAAKVARTESRARTRVLKARVDGVLEERTRLAREIHDTLLQHVTGIALQLRAALPHIQTSPDDALTTLERVADLAENTSREARQVVWDMRPGALNEEEFVRAVEITAHRTLAAAPVALQFTASGRPSQLDEEAQRVVLRIVQEAMANVVRHAAANAIRLTLSFGARRLRVAVTDDGRGFNVESDFRSYAGHWGLVGMQERADQIGASLRVQSALHRGTTVTFDLRLSGPRAKQRFVTRPDRESAIA